MKFFKRKQRQTDKELRMKCVETASRLIPHHEDHEKIISAAKGMWKFIRGD